MPSDAKTLLKRCGIALGAAVVSVGLRWLLEPVLGTEITYLTLFPAVAIAAYYAGFRASLLTIVSGVLAVNWLVNGEFIFRLSDTSEYIQLVAFLITGTFVAWITAERQEAKTELKRVETESELRSRAHALALRESEERSQLAQSTIGLGIWDWDLVADKVTWSNGIYQLVGVDPENIGNPVNTWVEYIVPEDREIALRGIRQLIDEGSPNFYGEFRVRRVSDNRICWMATQGKIIRENGAAVRLLGVNFDINETKATELKIQNLNRELTRRVRELQTIIELTPVGIAVAHDASCDVVIANPALAEILGVNPGDNVSLNGGKPPYRLLRNGRVLAPKELPMQRAVAEKRSILNEELDIERADGSVVSVYGYAAPVYDDDENVIGCVAAQIDVTARKKYELGREQKLDEEQVLRRQAEEASRLKDEFLATVSHELRTPLNSIIGWTAVMKDASIPADSKSRAIDAIERGARSQSQLIEDLLDVSRIISGKLQLDVTSIDIKRVIDAAVETVSPAAAAKKIDILIDFEPDLGRVPGDFDRLQQVAWNLLSNAIKFTPAGGQVVVSVRSEGSSLVLSVADTGKGISREFLPFVFDRFRQADGSITRKFSGLGLGLAIVRHLVELHGGSVSVDSGGEDLGSTFFVRLPVMAVEADENGSNGSQISDSITRSPLSLEGVAIIVIDDEPDTCEVLKITFERLGATVKTFASSVPALESLKRSPPSMIVSDIGLPDEDGYAFIRKVRIWERSASRTRVPAIALTAYARAEDRQDALAAGYNLHIAKPVEPSFLADAIAELLVANDVRVSQGV
ncbi:MAG: ATP-binding protein [Pyrinomonadaceae bacterium]